MTYGGVHSLTAAVTHILKYQSFSLPVYQKWAKMMTHPKDKKAGGLSFKERKGLYTTLRSIYEGIRLDETEGCGLRKLYADFLTEAATVLKNPALNDAAAAYQTAAAAWQTLAHIVLPDTVVAFKETKRFMDARYAAYRRNDATALRPAMTELEALEAELNGTGFPLDDNATDVLFAAIAEQLNAVYRAETAALDALKNVRL